MEAGSGRIRLISILVFLLAALFVGRLFLLQVVHGADFSSKADSRFIASETDTYNRGTIYFKEKDGTLISAATLKERYVVAINPMELLDPDAAFAALSSLATTSKAVFMQASLKTDDPYEEVGTTYSKEVSQNIRDLGIRGLDTYRVRERFYPAGSLAAHVLGFTGHTGDSGDEVVGRYGLEQFFDDELRRDNPDLYVNVFADIFTNLRDTISTVHEDSFDVITTIEPTVQAYLEDELAIARDEHGAKVTGGIIIDPTTGDLLALAANPTFDPNDFSSVDDASVYVNPLVEHVYEMGSVVKPLTLAAGLDAGVITPETTYNDKGVQEIDGYKVANYDGRARGIVDMQEVLSQSLNLGTVFVGEELGEELFREYFNRYRLGNETHISLPGEVSGLTENLSSTRLIERATASFGQGIAMSPLALTQAFTAFANEGAMVRPRVVSALRYSDGTIEEKEPIVMGLPIDEETAETITRMLVTVVDEALLGGSVALPEYSIAAKTGTAQIADPEGGYYDDRYLHSFFGYVPAYEPRFLVFLFMNEPQDELYASHTLTYPFMNLAEFLLNYYEIPPDREPEPLSP